MEKSSPRKVLEPQKALLLCARVGEISPKRIEWKKVRKNGEEDLIKLGASSSYKKGHFLPSRLSHPGGIRWRSRESAIERSYTLAIVVELASSIQLELRSGLGSASGIRQGSGSLVLAFGGYGSDKGKEGRFDKGSSDHTRFRKAAIASTQPLLNNKGGLRVFGACGIF
ncbi:hypothetical protein L3X38_015387 [Prunus dulcis]|uniref:Uncharacterized protein n=1 Tax=Prunus dulcis TaxID=3755 RepID=A0AAD4WQ07_PRUDU|nr:hypothetical protein L3X38_015387 [Prunus dulcis]